MLLYPSTSLFHHYAAYTIALSLATSGSVLLELSRSWLGTSRVQARDGFSRYSGLKQVFSISHFPGMEDSCPGPWWIENLHAVHWKVWKNLHDGGWVRDGLHAFRHRCARLTDLMQARTGYKNGTRKKGAFDCSHVDGDGERERDCSHVTTGCLCFSSRISHHRKTRERTSLLVECSWALASLHSSIRLKLLEPSRIGTPRYLSCRAALTQASNPSDTAQRGGVSYGAQRGGIPGIPGIDGELSSTLA